MRCARVQVCVGLEIRKARPGMLLARILIYLVTRGHQFRRLRQIGACKGDTKGGGKTRSANVEGKNHVVKD